MDSPSPQSARFMYLRRSRAEEQEERATQKDVLASHRSRLLDLAARDGVELAESQIYAEIGSGDDIASRPAFVRLLGVWQRLPRNHGGLVYCTEISRLSRGLQSQQGLVQDTLARAGVLIRTPYRYYDLRIDEDAFVFECEGLIARAELRNAKRRYAAGFDELTRQGRPTTGKPPPGYTWDKNEETFVPNSQHPILQAALKELFRESVERVSARYGMPKKVLLDAARNPVVCGFAARRYGRHHGEKSWKSPYYRLPRDQWVWPEKPGDWLPAITRPEWEALQEVLDSRSCGKHKVNSDEGWCRDVLQFRGSPGRVHLSVHSYPGHRVLTYEREQEDGRRLYVSRAMVHAAAEELLYAALGPDSDLPGLIAQAIRSGQRPEQEAAQHQGDVERDLARLRAQLDDITLQATHPDTDPEKRASLARIEKQVTALIRAKSAELKAAQTVAVALPRLDDLTEELPMLQANFPVAWASLEDYRKRSLIARSISLIEVAIGPGPDRRSHSREVTACIPAPWLAATMGRQWAVNGTYSPNWGPSSDVRAA